MGYVKKTNNPLMGRPKKVNSKDAQISVRLDEELLKKLDAISKKQGISRVDAIRRGIEKSYVEIFSE